MKINWYIVNERLFALEKDRERAKDDPVRWQEWVEEWNKTVDLSRTMAGCIKREKYDVQEKREERTEAEGKGDNVQHLHGHLAEEKTPLGGVGDMVG